MDIKQLKYFIAVAEELNFRLAAERLYISQPPLTRQIKKLEDELGVLLFKRDKKRVSLTNSGERFLQESRKIIKEIDLLKGSLNHIDKGLVGTLRINMTSFGISQVISKVIKKFITQYPQVDIIVNETSGTYKAKEYVLENKCDLIVTYGMANDVRLQSQIVEHDQVLYAVSKTNKFSNSDEISIEDLKHESFILFPRDLDPLWYDYFTKQCYSAGYTPHIIQHTESMWKRINLVSLDIGVTFVGSNFTKTRFENVEFIKPIDTESIQLPIYVSFNKSNDNPLIEKFLEMVNEDETVIKM